MSKFMPTHDMYLCMSLYVRYLQCNPALLSVSYLQYWPAPIESTNKPKDQASVVWCGGAMQTSLSGYTIREE